MLTLHLFWYFSLKKDQLHLHMFWCKYTNSVNQRDSNRKCSSYRTLMLYEAIQVTIKGCGTHQAFQVITS